MPQRQSPRGFPLRWTPLIVLVVIWNLLIGFEMVARPTGTPSPGPLSLTALWIVFGVSIAAIRFPNVQTLLLKPGRRFEEVKPIFLLVATVTGIMALIFGIIFASGGIQSKQKANKSSILTPDPPPVPAAMTIPPSTRSRSLVPGQA